MSSGGRYVGPPPLKAPPAHPDGRSEILPVFVYQIAISDGQLGFGSAISLLMLLINLVIAVVYLRLLRERRS